MRSLVYLIRNSVQTMPHSLFPSHDPSVMVFGIKKVIGTDSSSQTIEVLGSGSMFNLKTGQRFTYRQLLDVIIQAGKVITL